MLIYTFRNKAGQLNKGGQTWESCYLNAVRQTLISSCKIETINNKIN
jgi:hypothetical protein